LGSISDHKYIASTGSPQVASFAYSINFIFITMSFPDIGRYTITSARFHNLSVLPDANDEPDIVAGTDANSANEKACIRLFIRRSPRPKE
jgi:hypothetical protein